MDLVIVQGTGLGYSPSRGVDEDRRRAIEQTKKDALLSLSFSPEIVGNLEPRHEQGTREFALDAQKILLAADDFIVDTVSSQESSMPSGRLRAIYTYTIDTQMLRMFLRSENILVAPAPIRDAAPTVRERQPEQNDPPDPVDILIGSPTHQMITAPGASEYRGQVRTRPTIKSKIAGSLPLGTLIRIRQEFIGPGCEWHEIVVSNEEFGPHRNKFGAHRKQGVYVHRSQVARLPETPKSLEIACACRVNKNYTPPDWRNMPDQSPFLDKSRCEYSVVVTTPHTDTGGIELDGRKANAIPIGIMKLLKFYDKNS